MSDTPQQHWPAEELEGAPRTRECIAGGAKTIGQVRGDLEHLCATLERELAGANENLWALREMYADRMQYAEALETALKEICIYTGEGPRTTPWQAIVQDILAHARDALAKNPSRTRSAQSEAFTGSGDAPAHPISNREDAGVGTSRVRDGDSEGVPVGGARVRTPQDYAIEFGGYLATATTDFMDACNALDEARGRHEEAEPGEEAAAAYDVMYAAEERRSDLWNGLRNAVYEFEKRRDRALREPVQGEGVRPARCLVYEKGLDLRCGGDTSCPTPEECAAPEAIPEGEGFGWIPCVERKPPKGEAVLAFWPLPMGVAPTPQCYSVAVFSGSGWHNHEDEDDDYADPSYWTPLKSPPATEHAPEVKP